MKNCVPSQKVVGKILCFFALHSWQKSKILCFFAQHISLIIMSLSSPPDFDFNDDPFGSFTSDGFDYNPFRSIELTVDEKQEYIIMKGDRKISDCQRHLRTLFKNIQRTMAVLQQNTTEGNNSIHFIHFFFQTHFSVFFCSASSPCSLSVYVDDRQIPAASSSCK